MDTGTRNTLRQDLTVLAIETSCDETAVSIVAGERSGTRNGARFTVLGNALLSQIDIHKEYGGVYPMIAKREHAKNLVPLLGAALEESAVASGMPVALTDETKTYITTILEREQGLAEALLALLEKTSRPEITAIAVTAGPGLEPALWVGVNFARALSRAWDVPLVSVNHMEGHICTALATADRDDSTQITIPDTELPLLSLLISGGHTELVLSSRWGSYELVGRTRDDAVGEAFDKVARMLGLPYPGGPEVSALAERARSSGRTNSVQLPRPMLNDPHCDFSFSGLKTAVLYMTKGTELSPEDKENIAWAFEDAAADVLYAKTVRAIEESDAQTLALGGGVSANTHIKRTFRERLSRDYPDVHLAIPAPALTTDNAIMIGLAGYYRAVQGEFVDAASLRADGNRRLST